MKIIFDGKQDIDISKIENTRDRILAYEKIEEARRIKATSGCDKCPVCKSNLLDYVDDYDLSFKRNIIENRVILNTTKITTCFFGIHINKRKIPVRSKIIYTCKKCGTIYESDEWSMEDIPYPNK